MIPESVHKDLLNWARDEWSGAWPHPMPPSRAASAEGRWVPPSDMGAPVEAKPPPINKDRAAIVRFVYKECLAHTERTVLLQEYIWRHVHQTKQKDGEYRFDRIKAARETGFPLYVYEPLLRAAGRHVAQALGG